MLKTRIYLDREESRRWARSLTLSRDGNRCQKHGRTGIDVGSDVAIYEVGIKKLNQVKPKPSHHFFIKPLPLQNETVWFILINCLDIFMTYMLLRFGGLESNPIANFFLQRWNIQGLVFFKMGVVAFVVLLAQIVAWRHERKGRMMLWAGSAIVGAVVIYSTLLFITRILLAVEEPPQM